MIFDRLANSNLYVPLHRGFAQAFEFLRRADLATLAEGRHDVDGDRLYVLIATAAGRGHDGAKMEAHRRYVDIQYVIRGTDEIGLKPTQECSDVELAYDDKRDVALWRDRPTNWLSVPPGSFTIFWPDDGHAPLGSTQETLKAVCKVAI
ncbi:MAG: YhcH/YjgK/YiaL family protein [Planctomycetaceae bacterium]|nr:YhcH/YjgK/YiaL family protein [Planctomycetaceae bacterium]